jgi:hypothetical protein
MDKKILTASEDLLKRLEKVEKFEKKYKAFPYREADSIIKGMKEIAVSLPDIKNPNNQDELIQSELKRRLIGEAFNLEQGATPRNYDFDTVVSMLAIPRSDMEGLRGWLLANKEETIEAIERAYQIKDIKNYELDLPFDIPSVRRQAEEFAAIYIQKYHKTLGKLLQDLTKVGEYLRDIDAVPTTDPRSYFHPLKNTLAIGIPTICFTTEDGNLQIRKLDLISLYGHEGMGHALNQVLTKTNSLPYFLTKNRAMTSATMESVAQFYEDRIFEDLKNSPKTQRELGIEHNFDELYHEAEDIRKLRTYNSKLFQYSIIVLADKSLGEPEDKSTIRKKAEILNEVTVHRKYPLHFLEENRKNFDSEGNLNPRIVVELQYCAQPVQRALDEFANQGITYEGGGRSKIDATLLKGFWTPVGYVNNARIRAQEKD